MYFTCPSAARNVLAHLKEFEQEESVYTLRWYDTDFGRRYRICFMGPKGVMFFQNQYETEERAREVLKEVLSYFPHLRPSNSTRRIINRLL